MEKKMQALRWLERGKLALQEIDVPECGEDDIILAIKAAGICGADMHWASGAFAADAPFTLGHEFAGVICCKGSHVSPYWQIGDAVVSDNTGAACGHCSACRRGDFVHCYQRKTLGCGMDGGFASYCKIPGEILNIDPNCLMKLPEGISFEEAAVMEPAANAYRAVVYEADVRPGDTVVIIGLGPLGLYSLQIAKAAGASNLICVGMRSDVATRFPLAKQFGATELIIADEENVVSHILEVTGPDGADVAIDAAGAPVVMKMAMEYLKHDGKFLKIGNPPSVYNDTLLPLIDKQISVIGHMGYDANCWFKVMNLVKTGQVDLKSMIGKVLPLEEYKTGYELMKTQQVAKAVLIPPQEDHV